jgi:two-component system response regulator (stage 0 sporulation protein F)
VNKGIKMRKIRVLLVDDEPDLVTVIKARIKSWGYDLLEAYNGKAAIAVVKEQKPDIIILDYRMPGMDGVQTLKKIRKFNNDIPVIMFTAHPDAKSIEGADQLGVSVYLPKVSIFSDVGNSLKTALRGAQRLIKKKA